MSRLRNDKTYILSLNPNMPLVRDEVALDLFTTGLGAYCGSIAVSRNEASYLIMTFNKLCAGRNFKQRITPCKKKVK